MCIIVQADNKLFVLRSIPSFPIPIHEHIYHQSEQIFAGPELMNILVIEPARNILHFYS
jgi:hypothetical protein